MPAFVSTPACRRRSAPTQRDFAGALAGIWVLNFVFTLTLLGLNPDIHVYK